MNKYETPKQAITLAWANKIMKDTPCSYYDYTDDKAWTLYMHLLARNIEKLVEVK